MLLRLAYVTVSNVFAVLHLLPVGDRDKDAEILALRHQLTVLQRQLGEQRVRFTTTDRTLLAVLLHPLPRQTLHRLRLLVRPDTVLRWHRDLLARRHAARSRPKRPGRPPTVRSIRVLVLRLARENPQWGIAASTVSCWSWGEGRRCDRVGATKDAGIDPAPDRASSTWSQFLHSQADALLACDFLETRERGCACRLNDA